MVRNDFAAGFLVSDPNRGLITISYILFADDTNFLEGKSKLA